MTPRHTDCCILRDAEAEGRKQSGHGYLQEVTESSRGWGLSGLGRISKASAIGDQLEAHSQDSSLVSLATRKRHGLRSVRGECSLQRRKDAPGALKGRQLFGGTGTCVLNSNNK